MTAISKFMSRLVKVEKTLIGAALLFATAIIMYTVITRRLGFAPQWGEESVRYLMIWITFIGSGICFRRSSHFGIDIIRRVKNETFQKIVSLLILISCATFIGLLFYYGIQYTAFTVESGQKTAALGWPIYLVYMSVPIGGGLTILHLIELFMSQVLGIYTIEEDEE